MLHERSSLDAEETPVVGIQRSEPMPPYAAVRHSYLWCNPPTRGSATTLAGPSGRLVAGRPAGVAFLRPICVRSSWS
jgi:hypothetical protein